jgi:hypothetical protein
MSAFASLSQKNVDHYNNHKTQHMAMIAVAGVVAVGAFRFMDRKIQDIQTRVRTIPG